MTREQALFFSDETFWGKAGNAFLILSGPILLLPGSLGIVWLMVWSRLPAAHMFPLFGALVLFLHLSAGTLWSFQAACIGTLVGLLGILLAGAGWIKISFAHTIVFFWALFFMLSVVQRRAQGARNRLEEESDCLDMELSALETDVEAARLTASDLKERIPAYHRLQNFLDDLIGVLTRQDLSPRAQQGLKEMFPKATVTLNFFPETGRASPEDVWGQRILSAPQATLFPARHVRAPTFARGRFMLLPLKSQDGLAGWVGLDAASEQDAFTLQDLRLGVIAGNLIGLALTNVDLYAKTQSLAVTDSLTGLFSRGYFMERFEEEFSKAKHRRAPLSLLLFDVDHFKKINDQHGHTVGDNVLRWLSRHILAGARETDFVARYGGDEFIILMPFTRGEEALDVANRLCQTVAEAVYRLDAQRIRLTVSMGLASLLPAHADKAALFRQSDEALYLAKKRGRNQVVAQ